MKKYSVLAQITKHCFEGELERLKIEYEDDHTMRVEVMYTDRDEFHLFYIVEVHLESRSIDFEEHYCNYGRDYINLQRNMKFEHELHDYLFPQ